MEVIDVVKSGSEVSKCEAPVAFHMLVADRVDADELATTNDADSRIVVYGSSVASRYPYVILVAMSAEEMEPLVTQKRTHGVMRESS